jgi:SEC-C motif
LKEHEMRTGSTVCFSSHPHPFLIDEDYGEAPDGACREAWFTFTEILPGRAKSKLRWFQVCVDLDNWREQAHDRPGRSPQTAIWVREFLAEFPESRRAECRAEYDGAKRDAQKLAEYVIEPDVLATGRLFSYADVFSGSPSLSSGGRSFLHRFPYQGCEYLVEDMYCAHPACDCREVYLKFWENAPGDKPNVRSLKSCFLGRWTMGGGELEIHQASRRSADESQEILQAWWDVYDWCERMLRTRYKQVKALGRRSLARLKSDPPPTPVEKAPCALAAPSQPPDTTAREPLLADNGRDVLAQRTGRNDPCPCGSGKKFKRCCGARVVLNPR